MRDDDYFRTIYRVGFNHSSSLAFNLYSVHLKTNNEKRMARVICKVTIENNIFEQSMMTEVTILTKFDHQGLGIVYEYFQDSQNYYIILNSYKIGLQKYLSRTDSNSEVNCAKCMQQIFYFLAYLHINNIAYRALSLESIFFNTTVEEGVLKFVDLYYSKFLGQGEKYGDKVGYPHFIAPEVLLRQGACYSDLWSAGVLLHILLSGKAPFNAKSEGVLNSAIRAGRLEFKEPAWTRVSDTAKDLVRRLLKVQFEERITAAEALTHPWIIENAAGVPTVENAAPFVVNLANFHTQAYIKRKLLRYVSYYFCSVEEECRILEIFGYLDSDKNGIISKSELTQGFSKLFGNKIKTKQIEDILREVDLNESGGINYKEFIIAVIGKQKLFCQSKILSVFNKIDSNNDGVITVSELRESLSAFVEHEEPSSFWQLNFNQIDLNRDGNISFEEFMEFMLRK